VFDWWGSWFVVVDNYSSIIQTAAVLCHPTTSQLIVIIRTSTAKMWLLSCRNILITTLSLQILLSILHSHTIFKISFHHFHSQNSSVLHYFAPGFKFSVTSHFAVSYFDVSRFLRVWLGLGIGVRIRV